MYRKDKALFLTARSYIVLRVMDLLKLILMSKTLAIYVYVYVCQGVE